MNPDFTIDDNRSQIIELTLQDSWVRLVATSTKGLNMTIPKFTDCEGWICNHLELITIQVRPMTSLKAITSSERLIFSHFQTEVINPLSIPTAIAIGIVVMIMVLPSSVNDDVWVFHKSLNNTSESKSVTVVFFPVAPWLAQRTLTKANISSYQL